VFRVSQFMQELSQPTPLVGRRDPPGPVVIWNLIRRCNLTCQHCYSISADVDFPGELSTAEVFTVMDDLKAYGVAVLILSGGEPLLRPDIFEISRRAKSMGFYVGLSSNGTLITNDNIADIEAVGYDYVGVSLDGMRDTHDRFRRKPGAFDDPRIHFAVNCASIGCPVLREEAYVASRLDAQLEEQTIRFLSDRSRNRYNVNTQALEVSKVFDWYRKDFDSGLHAIETLQEFFAMYAHLLADTAPDRRAISAGAVPIRFLDYDWNLNDAER